MVIHILLARSPFGSQQNLAGGQPNSRLEIIISEINSETQFSSGFDTGQGTPNGALTRASLECI